MSFNSYESRVYFPGIILSNKNSKCYLVLQNGLKRRLNTTISLIVTNNFGEVIRKNFGRPIYGLPQIEPVFSLSHIPSKVFSGFATKSRTILKVDIAEKEGVFNFKNTYASPQRIIQITGKSTDNIIEIINENLNSIYSTMFLNEIQEKQFIIIIGFTFWM